LSKRHARLHFTMQGGWNFSRSNLAAMEQAMEHRPQKYAA
jgi:hypothetical protein